MAYEIPSASFLQLQLRLKGVTTRRELGQHFLFDEALLRRIADAANLDASTLAVEIGPGGGTLTAPLSARAGGVLAIEFDERLRALHADVFGGSKTIGFRYADALRIDLHEAARTEAAARGLGSMVLTGNLPFQITSPLLFAQCGPQAPWRRMAVMVQKEVADRIAAAPGCKAYGILTVKLAYWWKLVERFEVPATAFTPRPQVDAAVLAFDPLPRDESPSPDEWAGLTRFVDAAFGQRRKMLVNSLAGGWPRLQNKEAARNALAKLSLSEEVRAEDLSADQLRKLHALLSKAT